MRFAGTELPGVVTASLEAVEDERGFFARAFCDEEFSRAGIVMTPRQVNLSHNDRAFTLRGMHYQEEPHGEIKVVQCVRGRIFDVAVDLRRDSPTYRGWFGVELAPAQRRLLVVPKGCAHGYLTLEDDTDVLYLVSTPYVPAAGRGVRWNDKAFNIVWPAAPRVIVPRDDTYPDFPA